MRQRLNLLSSFTIETLAAKWFRLQLPCEGRLKLPEFFERDSYTRQQSDFLANQQIPTIIKRQFEDFKNIEMPD